MTLETLSDMRDAITGLISAYPGIAVDVGFAVFALIVIYGWCRHARVPRRGRF